MVYDVAVYLSTLPKISDRNRKVEVLQAFYQGAQSLGLNVCLQQERHIVPAKLAVIIGWYGSQIKGPHIQLRKDIVESQQQQSRHTMCIDGSCFKFQDINNRWLRYSLNGVFYNSSIYANHNSDAAKWNAIARDLRLEVRPWRSGGGHIVVCLQRDSGWNMKGTDVQSWTLEVISKLRQHTRRQILVRQHPKSPVDCREFFKYGDVVTSTGTTLQQDLEGAWASVYYNSSSCVASVLAGIPIFVTDDDCVAWPIANRDLALIETPQLLDRQQWLNDLAAAHWCDDESRRGDIYQKFRGFL